MSKNTLVAVFKCYAFAVMKDVADESNDIRLLSENLKTLFKLNIIESKTLDGRGGSDRSTKRSFEREAETYARSFAKCCCSASTSLNLTSTLADFLADAIVSASKRTSLDAFVDEEFARPTRFNQPEEHDGNNTSSLARSLEFASHDGFLEARSGVEQNRRS